MRVYLMNKLILIIITIISFQSFSKAEDIKDFQIEGMSIGDSFLDHMSSNEIKSAYQNASYYKNNTFAVIFAEKDSKIYDRMQVTLKPNDETHKIFAIEGVMDFDKKIDLCNKQKKIIIQDLKNSFSDYQRNDDDGNYTPDPSNNSFSYTTYFFFNSGGHIAVSCREMGNEIREKYGWRDELVVSVTSKEMEDFLRSDAY